jgi:hypothetical protein
VHSRAPIHTIKANPVTVFLPFLSFAFILFQIDPKDQCVVALTKMSSCPACQGIPEIRPCPDYCVNVMKGCLAYHAELGESWDKFIGE